MLDKQILSNYRLIQKEIKRLEDKLEYYRKHPLQSAHNVVTGSMHEFPYTEQHFHVNAPADEKKDAERSQKIGQLLVDLTEKKAAYEELKLEIDIAIESIEDIELRQIAQYKFIENLTDQEIADILCYERSSITKKLAVFR